MALMILFSVNEFDSCGLIFVFFHKLSEALDDVVRFFSIKSSIKSSIKPLIGTCYDPAVPAQLSGLSIGLRRGFHL